MLTPEFIQLSIGKLQLFQLTPVFQSENGKKTHL